MTDLTFSPNLLSEKMYVKEKKDKGIENRGRMVRTPPRRINSCTNCLSLDTSFLIPISVNKLKGHMRVEVSLFDLVFRIPCHLILTSSTV